MASTTLVCADCGGEFAFAPGERRFFSQHGFDEPPRRCPRCRAARKSARRAAHRRTGTAQSARFDAVCASCGGPARVSFRPATGRPIYCEECYTVREGYGSRG